MIQNSSELVLVNATREQVNSSACMSANRKSVWIRPIITIFYPAIQIIHTETLSDNVTRDQVNSTACSSGIHTCSDNYYYYY